MPLYEENVKLTKDKYGSDHHDTLNSMNSLALAYHHAGKLNLAVPLFEETLRIKHANGLAPNAAEAKRLSDLARKWLRADLVLLTGQANDAKNHAAVRRLLTRWQRDPDLSAVRNAASLPILPAADQKSWQTFWADVAMLLGRVSQLKG